MGVVEVCEEVPLFSLLAKSAKRDAALAVWEATYPELAEKGHARHIHELFEKGAVFGFDEDALCFLLQTGLHPKTLLATIFSVPKLLRRDYVVALARCVQQAEVPLPDLSQGGESTLLSALVRYLASSGSVTAHPYLPPMLAVDLMRLDARRCQVDTYACEFLLQHLFSALYVEPNKPREGTASCKTPRRLLAGAMVEHVPLLCDVVAWLTERALTWEGSQQIRTLEKWVLAALVLRHDCLALQRDWTSSPEARVKNLLLFAQGSDDEIRFPKIALPVDERTYVLISDIWTAPALHGLFSSYMAYKNGAAGAHFLLEEWVLLRDGYLALGERQREIFEVLLPAVERDLPLPIVFDAVRSLGAAAS